MELVMTTETKKEYEMTEFDPMQTGETVTHISDSKLLENLKVRVAELGLELHKSQTENKKLTHIIETLGHEKLIDEDAV